MFKKERKELKLRGVPSSLNPISLGRRYGVAGWLINLHFFYVAGPILVVCRHENVMIVLENEEVEKV